VSTLTLVPVLLFYSTWPRLLADCVVSFYLNQVDLIGSFALWFMGSGRVLFDKFGDVFATFNVTYG